MLSPSKAFEYIPLQPYMTRVLHPITLSRRVVGALNPLVLGPCIGNIIVLYNFLFFFIG